MIPLRNLVLISIWVIPIMYQDQHQGKTRWNLHLKHQFKFQKTEPTYDTVNEDGEYPSQERTSGALIDLDRESPAEYSQPEVRDLERISTLRPRTTKPSYMPWKINLATAEAEDDPTNFRDAMKRSDKAEWFKAMQEEIASLVKNNVWKLVDRPADQNIVTNRWVLRIKRKPNGAIDRYRARLVARGFSQVHGIDYSETYAPVAHMSSIRMLFAHAAIHGLRIAQFDVKTAFLYGDLDEKIFMEQPEGFVEDSSKVWLLQKSLYGLKQAPRQWNQKFTNFLIDMNLQVCEHDKCIFYRSDFQLILAIYVDDGIIFSESKQLIEATIDALKTQFEIHLVSPDSYLGFQISRSQKNTIFLHQDSYVKKVVTRFNMKDSKPEKSPLSPTEPQLDPVPLDEDVPYREAIGSLMYAAVTTRIDIAFAVGLASRSVAQPAVGDWQSVKRILRYLNGQPELGLCYSKFKDKGLIAYCDADLGGCAKTERSTSGCLIMLGGAPIHWRSSRQTMVTLSSTEAELVSLCSCVKDLIWLRMLALSLGIIKPGPTTVFCDNTSAMRIASNEKSSLRTKHMRIQAAYTREQVDLKEITLEHKPTSEQLADMLTKRTAVKTFIQNRDKVMASKPILAAFIAMLALAICASAYKFEAIHPIVYQATDKFVDMGDAQYSIDYTYQNPCPLLMHLHPVELPIGMHPQEYEQELAPIKQLVAEFDKLYGVTWMMKINESTKRFRSQERVEI